jgi:hypothetical protein
VAFEMRESDNIPDSDEAGFLRKSASLPYLEYEEGTYENCTRALLILLRPSTYQRT